MSVDFLHILDKVGVETRKAQYNLIKQKPTLFLYNHKNKFIMKRLFLILAVPFVLTAVHAQHMSFGNYVYQDNTSQSRQAAADALVEAAQRIEDNQYRTYEDFYTIQYPESCTFDSYEETTAYGKETHYFVTIPELNVTVECKPSSYARKKVYGVSLVRNGNGKIVRYGMAQ